MYVQYVQNLLIFDSFENEYVSSFSALKSKYWILPTSFGFSIDGQSSLKKVSFGDENSTDIKRHRQFLFCSIFIYGAFFFVKENGYRERKHFTDLM